MKSNQCGVVERGAEPPLMTAAPCLSTASVLRTGYLETARLRGLLAASPSSFLGIIRHARSPGELPGTGACPLVCLDLPQSYGTPLTEVWTSSRPVRYQQAGGITFAMTEDVLFGALEAEEGTGSLLDQVTYRAYRRLLNQAHALGYPHLLRVWNYFPRINGVCEGLERYQRFCAGRYQALAEKLHDFPHTLPAGTAIGTRSGPLSIHFLAAREPGMHVENPRQVRAYEYPVAYGPRSPSFARATLRRSASGSHLLIAGTASVVGHRSKHIGEPHHQTLEIIRNLNAVISRTEQLHRITRAQWFREALFKVYIRFPEHFAPVRDVLHEQLPAHSQVLYLHGEMCRSELLVEIEGILGQGKPVM